MPKRALFFGSIGSVVESSDIQRRAYNQALKEAGLTWVWEPETYAELLNQSGGKERLAMLASATGSSLSPEQIATIHERKTTLACAELIRNGITLRPGVAELMQYVQAKGFKLAFVTTTYQPNIDALFQAAGDTFVTKAFHYIGTRTDVKNGKPAPDAYQAALASLQLQPTDVLAIEDSAASVMAAKRAGISVAATPGAFTGDQDFWQADLLLSTLLDAHGQLDQRVLTLLSE